MNTFSEAKDQMVKNGFWGIISSIINRVGGFVLIILISRMLLPTGFGRYSLAMAVALFLITFSDFGINQTLIRYVSLEIDKNPKKASMYFCYLFKVKIIISLIISLCLLLISYPLSKYVFNDIQLFFLFLILSMYIFFTSLNGYLESLFFIKKDLQYISAKEFFLIILKLLFVVFIGLFIIEENNIFALLLSFSILALLNFLFMIFISKKRYSVLFEKHPCFLDKKKLSKFIFFLNIQNISILILSNMNIIFLGIFSNSEAVGYYNSSWAIITGLVSLLFSFSYLLLPILTRVTDNEFKIILNKSFRLIFILAFPISFGLSLLSKFFIQIIYGLEFTLANKPLSILAFLIPFIVCVDLSLASFSARNKQKKFSIIILISVIISFILSWIFLAIFSDYDLGFILIGVAIINLVTWFFSFLLAVMILKKEFGVSFSFNILFKSILSCIIMSVFILSFLNFFPNLSLFTGIILIILSALIYLGMMIILRGIEKKDFLLLKELVMRLKNHS